MNSLLRSLFQRCPCVPDRIKIWKCWFCGGRKTGDPKWKPFEQGQEPTTNSTHIWRQHWESNLGHIGGRRVLSPLRHLCRPPPPPPPRKFSPYGEHQRALYWKTRFKGVRALCAVSLAFIMRFKATQKRPIDINLKLKVFSEFDKILNTSLKHYTLVLSLDFFPISILFFFNSNV